MKRLLLIAIFLLSTGLAFAVPTNEIILNYHSDIIVHKNSTMTVVETIKVYALGDEIRRGIYRDFPVIYRVKYGLIENRKFEVLEVLRDGKPENHFFEDQSAEKRLYIGKEDVFLDNGSYTYTIKYKTDKQIKFTSNYTELYWNVTGNNWSFPIEKASATVHLPKGAIKTVSLTEGYTGYKGSTNSDCNSTVDPTTIKFNTTRKLKAKQGFTIKVRWANGYITATTKEEKLLWLAKDNLGMFLLLSSLILIFVYYIVAWIAVGIDPKKGTILTLFNPPHNMSPAALRFIKKMAYDDKALSSAIINMAVKGYLTIENKDNEYILTKKAQDEGGLSNDETKLAKKLFESGTSIELTKANYITISGARRSFKNSLKTEYEKRYFLSNKGFFIPGLLLSIVTVIVTVIIEMRQNVSNFIFIWLAFWTMGVTVLIMQTIKAWIEVFSGKKGCINAFTAIFLTLFSIPFLGGEVFGIFMFVEFGTTSFWAIPAIFILVAINIIFFHLLKAPTLAGRKLLDEIEGFKRYINVAEKNRMRVMNPPNKTIETFEEYLPYAVAFDMEKIWGAYFDDVINNAMTSSGSRGYSPIWYSGMSFGSGGLSGFTNSLGSSLTTAVSSSSTSSSSSSGGSSGGGGGGGGGGGW